MLPSNYWLATLNPRCLESYSYSQEHEMHRSLITSVDNLTMPLECMQQLDGVVSTLG